MSDPLSGLGQVPFGATFGTDNFADNPEPSAWLSWI